MTRACDQCGQPMAEPLDAVERKLLEASRVWCSKECGDAALKDEPGWIAVEDLSAEQRAELLAVLHLSEAKA